MKLVLNRKKNEPLPLTAGLKFLLKAVSQTCVGALPRRRTCSRPPGARAPPGFSFYHEIPGESPVLQRDPIFYSQRKGAQNLIAAGDSCISPEARLLSAQPLLHWGYSASPQFQHNPGKRKPFPTSTLVSAYVVI